MNADGDGVVESYVYWIAAHDRAYGVADARRLDALRAAWRAHRLVKAVSPFDGASFWIQGGAAHARIIRTVDTSDERPVEVLDIDPALI